MTKLRVVVFQGRNGSGNISIGVSLPGLVNENNFPPGTRVLNVAGENGLDASLAFGAVLASFDVITQMHGTDFSADRFTALLELPE